MFINELKQKFRYFGDMSSLHGVRYVFSTSNIPSVKRWFWATILTTSCIGAGLILRSTLRLFSTNAASYSVQTDYLDWDTPFPAVTVCENVDNGMVKIYLNQNQLPITLSAFYKEITFWSKNYCRTCNTCTLNETCTEGFLEVIKKIRLRCSELLTDCWFGGRYFKCCKKFQYLETEYGPCFVFNSALLGNRSLFSVSRRVGLPSLVFTAVEQVAIRVHSPEDVVSVPMENILGQSASLPMVTNFDAILKVEETVNDMSVKTISPSARGCLFSHERPPFQTWPFNRYSYSYCLLYCRGLSQTSYCNCTYHFLSNLVQSPACGVRGLACLYQNKENILKFKCSCRMACDDIQYKAVHVSTSRVPKPSPELMARGTRARIRFLQLPTLRVRRFAIKDNLGLAVDIGGMGGVFFGASLLSLMEVIYLLCIRRT